MAERRLPGFGLSMGVTLTYLSLVIMLPLSMIVVRTYNADWGALWATVSAPRTLAAFRLSFGAALAAASINLVFGVLVAWVLERYTFPLKRLVDALVDLPFALPTAVAGIALASVYAKDGWIGRWLEPLGIEVAFTPLGIVVALVFVGLPFVVRTIQPVLEDLDPEYEEAGASLGGTRWQTFKHVILPTLKPALITGFALAFARGVGEYGSVVFVSGNMPYKTEIAPILIVARLEEFAYGEATAIAVVLLVISFAMLVVINLLERASVRHER